MRIPVKVIRDKKEVGKEQAVGLVKATIQCGYPRFFGPISFMVDSGATMQCCLTEQDMKLLRFDFHFRGVSKVPENKWPNGFNGKIETYVVGRMNFWCIAKDNNGDDFLFKTTLSRVEICKGSPPGLKSVLGSQFFIDNNLRLVYSPVEGEESYLEQI